ncbi:hypothetical protein TNCV_2756051 [Trichonephila clavipes]|nr:hypothetical protein TNCV_2756051 [Trichonephila clavipes]
MVLQKSKHSAEFLMRDNWSRSSSISGGETTVLGVAGSLLPTDSVEVSIFMKGRKRNSQGKKTPLGSSKRAVLYNEEPRVEKKAGR